MPNSCRPSDYSRLLPCLVFTLLSLQYVLISNIADTSLITLNGIALHLWKNSWENFVPPSNMGKTLPGGFLFLQLPTSERNSACAGFLLGETPAIVFFICLLTCLSWPLLDDFALPSPNYGLFGFPQIISQAPPHFHKKENINLFNLGAPA